MASIHRFMCRMNSFVCLYSPAGSSASEGYRSRAGAEDVCGLAVGLSGYCLECEGISGVRDGKEESGVLPGKVSQEPPFDLAVDGVRLGQRLQVFAFLIHASVPQPSFEPGPEAGTRGIEILTAGRRAVFEQTGRLADSRGGGPGDEVRNQPLGRQRGALHRKSPGDRRVWRNAPSFPV